MIMMMAQPGATAAQALDSATSATSRVSRPVRRSFLASAEFVLPASFRNRSASCRISPRHSDSFSKGRKAANGQVFNDHALTAAHRPLPMGSLIVVTNLKTGESAAMRITDRGPFVEGRLIDLSIASAKATGVYL